MTASELHERIETVRRFNRFYTRRIGALQEGLLKSPFSLTEARVLYELANRTQGTASAIGEELRLDAGYLSRILRDFGDRGLIEKKPSEADGRQSILHLTESGNAAFKQLEAGSREEIGTMLQGLAEPEQHHLVEAMRRIEDLLSPLPEPPEPFTLRPHKPGDMGWVIHRHGLLYWQEYGWDERFEALVAEIAAAFIQNLDRQRERCWIAERHGENVGSVFLVKKSEKVAKLRLLLVEPKARGLGIGRRLVEECIGFARRAGYETITLWTNDILHAARHIYVEAGFQLIHEEPHSSFGDGLMGQTWELAL